MKDCATGAVANIPAGVLSGAMRTFTDITLADFDGLHGAVELGLEPVLCTDETTLGVPFDTPPEDLHVEAQVARDRARRKVTALA